MGYQEYRKDAMSCLGWHALGCRISWLLGVIFAVLGVVAAVVNITLGLGAANWLLLGIAAFVASIPCCLAWTVGMYLRSTEGKSGEEG